MAAHKCRSNDSNSFIDGAGGDTNTLFLIFCVYKDTIMDRFGRSKHILFSRILMVEAAIFEFVLISQARPFDVVITWNFFRAFDFFTQFGK